MLVHCYHRQCFKLRYGNKLMVRRLIETIFYSLIGLLCFFFGSMVLSWSFVGMISMAAVENCIVISSNWYFPHIYVKFAAVTL